MPAPPSDQRPATGQAPHDEPEAGVVGREQDRTRRTVDDVRGRISASVCPAAMRRWMSARIARDVGDWLSATDSPSHVGAARARVARRVARAPRASRSVASDTTTTRTTTTTTPSSEPRRQHPRRDTLTPVCRALRAAPRGLRSTASPAERCRSHDAVGRDHVRLGLTGRAEVERGLRHSGSSATGQLDRRCSRTYSRIVVRVVVADDADHREVGIVRCARRRTP